MGENGSSDEHDATREIQAPAADATTPAPVDTPQVAGSPDPLAAAAAGPGERGRLRRRLRKLKAARRRQRVEIGALVFDARKRANGSRPEVVERRTAEAAEVERQVRELQHAVDAHADTRELAAGVAGSCPSCGTLLSTEDRFCPSCGTPTKPGRQRPVDEIADAGAPEVASPVAPAMPPPAGLPVSPAMPPPAGPARQREPLPTPARPLPAPVPAPEPAPMPSAEPAQQPTSESPAVSTAEHDAVEAPPPPPAADAPLAHADRSAIPPPPPPPPAA